MNPTLKDAQPSHSSHTPPIPTGKHWRFYRWLLNQMMPKAPMPLRISLWNGDQWDTIADPPIAHVRIHDFWALVHMLLNPHLGFGDGFSDGRIEVEGDLIAFLEKVFQAPPPSSALRLVTRCLNRLWYRPRDNGPDSAPNNIYQHYDLGNDFYRLWLDEQLLYTCAYFSDPDQSLEQAQVAKMDHVCRKLQLRPGDKVVEAGCGWGALALHAARHFGVTVKAFNLSREQISHARKWASAEGLDGRVEFVQDDYRNITGSFDAFMSVGMLEHVGLPYYRDLGRVIERCLKPAGRGLIHSIGKNIAAQTNPWLEKRIFPGAYMPSLREMMGVFEPARLSVLDVENLRLHYALTLDHWLQRFERAAGQIEAMFDQRLVRAYRLYLASSRASFSSGVMQLFQIVFAHDQNNVIPWTRRHIYEPLDLKDQPAYPLGCRH